MKTFIPWKPYYAQSIACNYNSQRGNEITSSTLQARIAGDKLTGLVKTRFENQLVKTNRALVDYAGQLAQDDLLPTRLPDKVQKPKWAKPRKTHGKASARSYTGVEVTELATVQAEQRSTLAAAYTARPGTPESDIEDVVLPSTSPLAGSPEEAPRD